MSWSTTPATKTGRSKTAAQCRELGVETEVLRADVAEDKDCRRLAAAAEARWGRLDGLVNNAGTTKFCDHNDLDGLDKQDFLRIYGVNTVGPYQMARAAAPLMRRGGCGSVVNVASIAGVMGVGSSIAYAASKGALITLGLSLARVLGAGDPRQHGVPRLYRRRLAGRRHGGGALRPHQGPFAEKTRPCG